MKKLAIILGLVGALTVGLLVAHAATADAHYHNWDNLPSAVCGEGEHVGNPHCSPSPTASPTSSPTATPSATPVDEPSDTPTPTPTPCLVWEGEFEVPCPSATPVEEPEVTPTPVALTDAGAPQQATCSDDLKVAPTILSWSRTSPHSVKVTWSSTGNIDSYIVFYGLTKDNLPWNTTVNHTHEVTLNDVPLNSIWVKVVPTDGVCQGIGSVTIDP